MAKDVTDGNVLDIGEERMRANNQIQGPRKRSNIFETFQTRWSPWSGDVVERTDTMNFGISIYI